MSKKWPDILTTIITSLVISFTMFRAGNSYAESKAFQEELNSKATIESVEKIKTELNTKVDAPYVKDAIETHSKIEDAKYELIIKMLSDVQRNQITNSEDIKDILKQK